MVIDELVIVIIAVVVMMVLKGLHLASMPMIMNVSAIERLACKSTINRWRRSLSLNCEELSGCLIPLKSFRINASRFISFTDNGRFDRETLSLQDQRLEVGKDLDGSPMKDHLSS